MMPFWDWVFRSWYGPCEQECRGFKCIHCKGHSGNHHGVLTWDVANARRV
jgi:hypothetical protein